MIDKSSTLEYYKAEIEALRKQVAELQRERIAHLAFESVYANEEFKRLLDQLAAAQARIASLKAVPSPQSRNGRKRNDTHNSNVS